MGPSFPGYLSARIPTGPALEKHPLGPGAHIPPCGGELSRATAGKSPGYKAATQAGLLRPSLVAFEWFIITCPGRAWGVEWGRLSSPVPPGAPWRVQAGPWPVPGPSLEWGPRLHAVSMLLGGHHKPGQSGRVLRHVTRACRQPYGHRRPVMSLSGHFQGYFSEACSVVFVPHWHLNSSHVLKIDALLFLFC